MGYEPNTIVERVVVWAEDQDSYSLSTCFYRVMGSFHEFLSKEEFDSMIRARPSPLDVVLGSYLHELAYLCMLVGRDWTNRLS